MTPTRPHRPAGMSLMEVLVVVVALVVLAGILLPILGRSSHHRGYALIKCVNNLKSIGLGYRIFATDNNGKLPMELSTNNGGTLEYLLDDSEMRRHWMVISNELSTPHLVVCPADVRRSPDADNYAHPPPKPVGSPWERFTTTNLSYFLGLNAPGTNDKAIFSGDRRLLLDGKPVMPGRLAVDVGSKIDWIKDLHWVDRGNLLKVDGSVESMPNRRFAQARKDALISTGLATNVWLVP